MGRPAAAQGLILALALTAPPAVAAAFDCLSEPLVDVRLDASQRVLGLTVGGETVMLLEEGRYRQPRLAADGCTFGALEVVDLIVELPGQPKDVIPVVEELQVRRPGGILRSVRPGLFIRKWTFWHGHSAVALTHGTRFGPVTYVLIDLSDGETMASFNEGSLPEPRPAWAEALDGLPVIPEAAGGPPGGGDRGQGP